jgi:hypothetical protein
MPNMQGSKNTSKQDHETNVMVTLKQIINERVTITDDNFVSYFGFQYVETFSNWSTTLGRQSEDGLPKQQ